MTGRLEGRRGDEQGGRLDLGELVGERIPLVGTVHYSSPPLGREGLGLLAEEVKLN
jgi:hypothetical protein